MRHCAAASAATVASGSALGAQAGPARSWLPLDGNWSFGKSSAEAARREFDDRRMAKVTLPHCVAKLSWQDWDPAAWADVWIYRRHFSLPPAYRSRRVFLQFEGVMTAATPVINGHALTEHLGAYLPFRCEITEWLVGGDNVLAVVVDSRWQNVPPEGSPKGPVSIDYLEPGGIFRPVHLYAVPQVFLSDVFAKPVKVLDLDRRVEVACSIDAGEVPSGPVEIQAALLDGSRVVSSARRPLKLEAPGSVEAALTLSNLGNIALWDSDTPRLYEVAVTLSVSGKPVHDYRVRIGFREARFDAGGFFLNGKRLHLFGLNRHELYPYVGGAMPRRVLRKDAEILRHDFHCNMVRCSHYPQSAAFLEACDELGLMVWEEIPGWQYLGDASWKDLAVRDVQDMVRRDRNHPAVVIWGVRINESANDPALYGRTRDAALSLDDSRPTSGSMTSTRNWQDDWHQDVFAFDDYHADPDGSVGLREPLPGVPYMLAEAVGQFNYAQGRGFDAKYRRTAEVALQKAQALRHAQAHEKGMALARCAGIVAWCAFDYGSLINSYRGVKCPGIADVFRIPKLGASFYQSQVDPQVRPAILPNFYWDFGVSPEGPHGPGKDAAIFSNCDRLEIFLDGKPFTVAHPDRAKFPHLKYPPLFCDLAIEGGGTRPDLRIDGYAGGRLALSRSFSADPAKDQFLLEADDQELIGDGSDATRLVFRIVDRYGAPRPFATGEVSFALTGPGVVVGDNPFGLTDSGGAGAVWIKTLPKTSGRIAVTATHSALGKKSVEIRVRNAG